MPKRSAPSARTPTSPDGAYAARLINLIVAKQLKRGIVPFLHVNETNARARALYARLGFADRALLPLWLLKTNLSANTAAPTKSTNNAAGIF